MVYVVLVLAGLLLLAIVIIIAMASGIEAQKKKVSGLEVLLDATAKEKAAVAASVKQESDAKESVIANLKKEIGELEKDLASNRDPAAVRTRLSKLLSDP